MHRFLLLIFFIGFFPFVGRGSDVSFTDIFRYFAGNVYSFDADGNPVKTSDVLQNSVSSKPEISFQITDDGCYRIEDLAGNHLQGLPGEKVFPCTVLSGKKYLLSEAGYPFLTLVQWDPAAGKVFPVGKIHDSDVFQVIYDRHKIIGIQYFDRSYEFFDPLYQTLHRKILDRYPLAFPVWRQESPLRQGEWLVEVLLPDRPAVWLTADVGSQTCKTVSAPPPPLPECGEKKWITFPARDGIELTAVLSYPPSRFGKKSLPLVVFPHGGPGSVELPFFDPRVAFLNAHGFLVLQPNYRSSSGRGKAFRFQGWKPDGIRAALEDIARGARHLIDIGVADPHRIVILGGSWGGYCALASLCFYPELYQCGISLFGASDLPEMLRSFPKKSHADAALDRLQYGDIREPDAEKALRGISPLFLAEKITAPIFLVHYQQDQVIEFSQSEKFYRKMKSLDKDIEFLLGDGEHGFQPPEKEAEIYRMIVDFIRRSLPP